VFSTGVPPLRNVAVAVAAVALGAPAAPATAAPSLAALKPCYVFAGYDPATGAADAETVAIHATGFRPGATVRVLVDGAEVASGARADAAGEVRLGLAAPEQQRGERRFTVTVADEADATQAASAEAWVTALAVRVRPRRGSPTRRVTFRGRGFTDLDRPVFGHYVRGGKVRRTVRLASRAAGPCGTFAVERRRLPFRRPAMGRWTLRVDQFPRYHSQPAGPFVELTIQVRRALRLGSRHG
jgi:hypothetical protein